MSTTPFAASPALIHSRPPQKNEPASLKMLARGDQPLLERRRRRDQLEGRAGRVAGLDRAVRAAGRSSSSVSALTVVGRDRRREDARVEGRGGAHAEDRAVVDVHRRRTRRAGRMSAIAASPASWTFSSRVSSQVVAGLGLDPRELLAARLAGGVDLDADRAVAAAEDGSYWASSPVAPIRSPGSRPS